jgi:hypothetical protein
MKGSGGRKEMEACERTVELAWEIVKVQRLIQMMRRCDGVNEQVWIAVPRCFYSLDVVRREACWMQRLQKHEEGGLRMKREDRTSSCPRSGLFL